MNRILTATGALVLAAALLIPSVRVQAGADAPRDPSNFRGMPSPSDRDLVGCDAALEAYDNNVCDGNCSDECRNIGQDLSQCQNIGNRTEVSCTN